MLWWLAENTIVASLLAAGVCLACRVRRFSPAVCHALWLVVLVRLTAPPLVEWPWSMPFRSSGLVACGTWTKELITSIVGTTTEPVQQLDAGGERFAAPRSGVEPNAGLKGPESISDAAWEFQAIESGWSEPLSRVSPDHREPAHQDLRQPERSETAETLGQFRATAALLWLVGAAISAGIHGVQIMRFRKGFADSLPAPQPLVERVRRVAALLRVAPPRISLIRYIGSPAVWGGLRTRLIWPAPLASGFETGRWDGVIAHELAHLRRGDHWVGWLELVTGCLWWWNPLFWFVRQQLHKYAELACDAVVVCELPSGREAYAASLIEVISHVSQMTAPVPVCGALSRARQAFERRLTMILSERVPSKLSVGSLAAITVLALGSLPGWIQAQTSAPPQRNTETPKVPVLVAEPPGPESVLTQIQAAAPVGAPNSVAVPVTVLEQSAGDDKRIDAVEKKLEQLIEEVKALRGVRNVVTTPTPELRKRTLTPAPSSDVQTLSRATYRLPKAKAEALAAFMRDHMKSPAEVKVEDDTLIVTTSPQAQSTIAQFIALSEGIEPPSRVFWYGGGNQPAAAVYGTGSGQPVYEAVPSKVPQKK